MENLPSLYQYYTNGDVISGLSDKQSYFTLNNKNITIYSGAMHYFRVPPKYWRDRLRKMRAAGLNTVETYVPWNLHESEPGLYDFGNGGTDFQEFLHIENFLKTAQEEDLFAIVRPGPYICAEWEFGGMPNWLLRHEDMKIRTSDNKFMHFVTTYFRVLFQILSTYQFTYGGPIIAFQIENEYGNVKVSNEPIDTHYLELLKNLFIQLQIKELLFTSDTPALGNSGSIPGILYAANFQNDSIKELDILKAYQSDKPFMVMEYWAGWYDHWTERHHTRTNEAFSKELENILNYPSSVNFYMFHGGTSWGFMNGANMVDNSTDNGGYIPDINSYDYDAPLSEAGDYTDKYCSTLKLIRKYNKIKTRLPNLPNESTKIAYEKVKITHMLNMDEVINKSSHKIHSKKLLSMEMLPINNNSGQSYGYIVYRKSNIDIKPHSTITIQGRVCDTVLVLINGNLVSNIAKSQDDLNGFGYWRLKNSVLELGPEEYKDATLDFVVENWGRNNYGKLDQFNQKKGLWQGNVLLNTIPIFDWIIFPLEFKTKWINNLDISNTHITTGKPGLFKAILLIQEEPNDTFIDMKGWNKGIIIVNGFVLSRYFGLGPQQTAYLPAPFLRTGKNEIIIFEHFQSNEFIHFLDKPIFKTR